MNFPHINFIEQMKFLRNLTPSTCATKNLRVNEISVWKIDKPMSFDASWYLLEHSTGEGKGHCRCTCCFLICFPPWLSNSCLGSEMIQGKKSFGMRYDKFDDVTYLQHCHFLGEAIKKRWNNSATLIHHTLIIAFASCHSFIV